MSWIALVGLAAASAAIGWVAGRRGPGAAEPVAEQVLPADHQHLLDLLRRAHRALAAVFVYEDDEAVVAEHPRGVNRDAVGRGEALARVALHDGRQHVTKQAETVLAVGDGGVGVAMVFPDKGVPEETISRALGDLRRLCAGLEAQYARERRWGAYRRAGQETLQAALADLCEQAADLAGVPAVVVLRDAIGEGAHVRRVSYGSDRRLENLSVPASAGAGRAAMEDTTITCETFEEMFGQRLDDRRQRDEFSMAFPLRDGGQPAGAVVVYGLSRSAAHAVAVELERIAMEFGPRVAQMQAVWAAGHRSTLDALTGLGNRRAMDERLAQHVGDDHLGFLLLDLDHFKKVNDELGHAAGDAVLKHVAGVLKATLREQDIPCRIGGEEIAVILPATNLAEAELAAERVRKAVEGSRVVVSGREIAITCSVGVAAKPETTSEVANLPAVADKALYKAKESGRNRVKVAAGS
ncbi:MAG: GGDEF domain-containing protein [Gemmatimonadales bacterium]